MTNGLILEVALVFEDQGAGLVWAVRRGTGVLGGTLLLVHHIADVVLEGVSADSLLHINTHVRVLLSTFFFVAGNTRHLPQKLEILILSNGTFERFVDLVVGALLVV